MRCAKTEAPPVGQGFIVDHRWQGQGIGKALLKDAMLRTLQAADIAGIRDFAVHAKDEEARHFYLKFDFIPPLRTRCISSCFCRTCGGSYRNKPQATWQVSPWCRLPKSQPSYPRAASPAISRS
jgi:hypothetical protein